MRPPGDRRSSGRRAHPSTLEDAKPPSSAISIGRTGKFESCSQGFRAARRRRRGQQTFDQRVSVHVMTALEARAAGPARPIPRSTVAAAAREGLQRDAVERVGYLFYIADRRKTDLPVRQRSSAADEWCGCVLEAALTPGAIVRLAEADGQARYGFNDSSKLKGGVFAGEFEMEAAMALRSGFPSGPYHVGSERRLVIEEAVRLCRGKREVLAYAEDPCRAENGYSGREILASSGALPDCRRRRT